MYGTVVSELTGQTRRTFQARFEGLGDGNVVADILAGNLRYEGPSVSNTNRHVSTTIEQSTAHEDDSGSSSEEEQVDDTSEVDLTTTVNWQEQAVTIDRRSIIWHIIRRAKSTFCRLA